MVSDSNPNAAAALAKFCTDRDAQILSGDESAYVPLNWSQIKHIIQTNDLTKLSRKPSDLKYYIECKQTFKEKYGGTMQYIIKERLKWVVPGSTTTTTTITTTNDGSEIILPNNPIFLADPLDVKILPNDFPYGVEQGIVHLVVWLKAKIPELADGVLSPEVKHKINRYVETTFRQPLGLSADHVLWFKNWSALQSVAELEHFHVLLYHPDPDKVAAIIGTAGATIA